MLKKSFNVTLISLQKIILILALGIASTHVIAGGTGCVVINSGNWSDINTWNCDTVSGLPESDSSVAVNATFSVTLDTDASIRRITVDAGASMIVANNPNGFTLQWSSFTADFEDSSIELQGDLTLEAQGTFLAIDLGQINGGFGLNVIADGGINFTQEVGSVTPLSSISTSGFSATNINSNITTTGTQTYTNAVELNQSVTLSASDTSFGSNVTSLTGSAPGFDLNVVGNVIFNADIGLPSIRGSHENASVQGSEININNLIVSGTTTVEAPAQNITTDGNQEYVGNLILNNNASFISDDNGNIIINGSGGAFDLAVTTSGSTTFRGDIGSPRHTSITTNGNGTLVLRGGMIDFLVEGSSPTTFNDNLVIGPSGQVTVDQAGSGDVIFNGSATRTSGGQKYLTVNDVSGQTIFNGAVALGRVITNDGTGDDVTVINTPTFNTDQGGSNNGVMTFNDPVRIMQDLVISESDGGQIIFNNSIDAGDGLFEIDLTIESDNEVILGPIGTQQPFLTLTTDMGGSSLVRDSAIASFGLTFNDEVRLVDTTAINSEVITFNGNVDLQTFDLSVGAIDVTFNDVISGSGNLSGWVDEDLFINAENTYTGQTTINNGQLNLSGAASNNNISTSSQINLANGTLLIPNTTTNVFALADAQVLAGEGTINNELLTNSGSTISPGNSPGALTGDRLEMQTGSRYLVEIDGTVPGTSSDLLTFNMVDLDTDTTGGADLDIIISAALSINDEIMVIDNAGAYNVNGTFNGLAEGATLGGQGIGIFSISYVGGDGNDVVLTVTELCATSILVTDGADSGPGTLREAVTNVCESGTVLFADDMTVNLSSEILIDKELSIDSDGHQVIISGGNSTRLFNVDASGNLELNAFTLSNGFSADGGGAVINAGRFRAIESTFSNNSSNHATASGGAIFNQPGAITSITRSTFINNQGAFGGAIYLDDASVDSTLVISNSTFTQNGSNSTQGGAIYSRGTIQSNNNTFAANGNALTEGGNLYTDNGRLTLYNTLVADALSGNDCFINSANSIENNTTSLIETGNCDAALTDDPQLQTLANNGGNTLTLALSLSSPAVDAGSNGFCTGIDQRGLARPQLNACDIGAYETEFLAVIRVGTTTPDRLGPCLQGDCWDNPYSNLQDALTAAGPGSEIWVQQGVYVPDVGQGQIDDDPTSFFFIPPGVALYGGFAGSETEREQRDAVNNLTIISGDIDGNDTNTDGNFVAESINDVNGLNAYNILFSNGDLILDGFTITAGDASGVTLSEQTGGALYCNAGSDFNRILSNNHWVGNFSLNGGGAIYVCGSSVSDSIFSGNYTEGNGGAVFEPLGSDFSNVSFFNNTAELSGGALNGGDFVIDRGYFAGNVSDLTGGAIFSFADLEISNALFSGNYGDSQGGALFVIGQTTITNATFTGNVSDGEGGAIYDVSSNTPEVGLVSIRNSIVWNNQDDSGVGTLSAGIDSLTAVTLSHSIFQGSGGSSNWNTDAGVDAGNNLDMDPEFLEAVNLVSVPTVAGNARLLMTSPAIEAGDNAVVNTALDLDGTQRIIDTNVDMGAFEQLDIIFKNGFDE